MIPLAERMRPKCLEDFVGQKQLSLLYEMINNDAVSSMIFWGPPGVGKTTLAKIIAHRSELLCGVFSSNQWHKGNKEGDGRGKGSSQNGTEYHSFCG